MQNRLSRPSRLSHNVALFAVTAVSAVGFASIARAQVGPLGQGGMLDPGVMLQQGAKQAPNMNKATTAPPPALPGAASNTESVAPATHIAADMSPNAALFDAINRGDAAAAREALSRGAELNARNLLGMTPMELSVDLGRNDISFLLLSYRGTDTPQGPSAKTSTAAVALGSQPKPAARSADHGHVIPVKAVVPTAPQAPRLFADDGGAPVPSAGFLGFGAGSAGH